VTPSLAVALRAALCPLVLLGCHAASRSGIESGDASSDRAEIATPVTDRDAAPPRSAVETWTGSYTSRPGTVYVYDGGEWAGITWRGDDADVGLGEGTMTLRVDRRTGDVRGTTEGALGQALITGVVADDSFSGSVLRRDPSDRGLSGTVVGQFSSDELVGQMHLSVANARVIRQVEFHLVRTPSGPPSPRGSGEAR
jgi:hypothetical protein